MSLTERVLARDVLVTRLDLPVAGLPEELVGFRTVHLSDIHVGAGAWMPIHAAEAARLVHAERPDVVVNTGDFVRGQPPLRKVGEVVQAFVVPEASGRVRNLAVLGNHDNNLGEDLAGDLARELESRGIRVLTDQAACVEREGAGVSFIGLSNDAVGFDRGVAALLAADRPRVALVHDPELAERMPPASADLVLAGHTHGGQIALPFLTPWIVRHGSGSHYVGGLYRVNGMPLCINRGLGCVGLPLRFRAPPEVTVIRLTL
jgi:predicted MPP superfamily phosphohydrolase